MCKCIQITLCAILVASAKAREQWTTA